jgi:glycosyltransferase involved in cell wall biosynthesis
MTRPERAFVPFQQIMVPITDGTVPMSALTLASNLGGEVSLIGLVCLSEQEPLSTGTAAARKLRQKIRQVKAEMSLVGRDRVQVSQKPWDDLQRVLRENPPDMLILEWPVHFDCLGVSPAQALADPPCNIALIRGPFPEDLHRILVPIRGGPSAELALRLGMAIPHQTLETLHISQANAIPSGEPPFRGLARIIPNLSGVGYRSEVTDDPVTMILDDSQQADLIVMGASVQMMPDGSSIGPVVEKVIQGARCAVVAVRSQRPLPTQWTGSAGEMAGAQAISLLVDKWFAENTYHAGEFDDLAHLVALKQSQNLTISLALPALNEQGTVGEVIRTIQNTLVNQYPLLDEVVLIDSNSTDQTREIAESLGAQVYVHQELLPQYGARRGKGEALWKSLLVTSGDIVIWIDTDIVNIHPRFVYGVIGPLLYSNKIQFVKGFYQRPLRSGERTLATGGGRVTELTARPLINLFYPELSGVIQPLSGEYGGRRKALEKFPFFSGYGVETGLLIDVFEAYGLSAIAQVDLLERVHHNQSLEALSKMSFTILQAFIRKLEKRYNIPFLEEINKSMKLIRYQDGNYSLEVQEVLELERPAMLEVPEYQALQNLDRKVVSGKH